jgi:hypothetical protein
LLGGWRCGDKMRRDAICSAFLLSKARILGTPPQTGFFPTACYYGAPAGERGNLTGRTPFPATERCLTLNGPSLSFSCWPSQAGSHSSRRIPSLRQRLRKSRQAMISPNGFALRASSSVWAPGQESPSGICGTTQQKPSRGLSVCIRRNLMHWSRDSRRSSTCSLNATQGKRRNAKNAMRHTGRSRTPTLATTCTH